MSLQSPSPTRLNASARSAYSNDLEAESHRCRGLAMRVLRKVKDDYMKASMIFRVTVAFLICSLYVTPVEAGTWYVPGDAATIKEGIDLASAGDTVLVMCGTYYEHDIRMKAGVCLRSSTGIADCTTIDAQQQDRVIYCRFVLSSARIEGFTIKGGLASEGGGMYCLDLSSPRVKDCIFTGNSASSKGGGIYCSETSSPTFINCVITGNSANENDGAGIFFSYNSSPTFTNCTFSGNTGGGIYCRNSCSPTLTGCTLSGNTALTGAGMKSTSNCTITLTGCTFSGNEAEWWGGGIYFWNCTVTLIDCTFSDNSGPRGGGMFLSPGGSVTLSGCSFTGNSVTSDGGGMCLEDASATLVDCFFTNNSAGNGGGMYLDGASYFAADTTKFDGNTASNAGAHGYVNSGSEAVLTCCVDDLTGFAGDGTITLNNEGCDTATERSSWGAIKALIMKKQ